ncbi:MAG: sugar transferase [Caldilinea sp.]
MKAKPVFYRRTGMRLFDQMSAIPALVLFSPVLAVLIVFVRFKLGSPAFFRQQRPDLHGQPFRIIKLRTMTELCSPCLLNNIATS